MASKEQLIEKLKQQKKETANENVKAALDRKIKFLEGDKIIRK